MANVPENLQQILTARYGKDVRQSIHDAIEANYEYANGDVIDRAIQPSFGALPEYIKPGFIDYNDGDFHEGVNVHFIGPVPYYSNVTYSVRGYVYGIVAQALYYDSSFSVVGHALFSDTAFHELTNIPANTRWILIQSLSKDIDLKTNAIYHGDIASKCKTSSVRTSTIFSYRVFASHYYYNGFNSIIPVSPNDTGLSTDIIDVRNVSSIRYNGSAMYQAKSVYWADEYMNEISSEQYQLAKGEYKTLTVPEGAAFARFQSLFVDYLDVVNDDQFKGNYVNEIKSLLPKIPKATASPLCEKKYCVCGDSYTAGTWSGSDPTYPKIIAANNYMNLTDLSRGGMSLTSISESNSFTGQKIYEQIPKDSDYITLMFGLNNLNSPDGDKNSTDISTEWGAWNTALGWIFTNIPKAHIGMIIPYNWLPQTKADLYTEIAKYWGVPVLNLKSDPNIPFLFGSAPYEMSPTMLAARDKVFKQSDNHPTPEAHAFMAPIVQSFMERI